MHLERSVAVDVGVVPSARGGGAFVHVRAICAIDGGMIPRQSCHDPVEVHELQRRRRRRGIFVRGEFVEEIVALSEELVVLDPRGGERGADACRLW